MQRQNGLMRQPFCLFFIALFIVILIVRYARKVKFAFIVSTFLAMKNKSLGYTMLHWSIVTHA